MNKNTQKTDTTPKKKRILPWLIPLIVGMIFLSLIVRDKLIKNGLITAKERDWKSIEEKILRLYN